MNILIFASQSIKYLPLDQWIFNDPIHEKNTYVLFVKKEHEEGYQDINQLPNVNIYSFDNWEKNNNIEKKAIDLHFKNNFDKLLSVREGDVERASYIRDYLNISGQRPYSAKIFRDKYIMKSFVANNGFKTPNFQKVHSYIDALNFLDNYKYPAVIKPIDGAGSVNTLVLKSKEDLDRFAASNSFANMIIESFAKGEVYHLDGIILDNKLEFITVSKYINNCLAYQEGKSTASIFINQDSPLSIILKNYGKALLNILPCPQNMTFHLEIFVDNHEITFCEIACRTGGGRIAECIEAELGIHITKEFIKRECGFSNVIDVQKNKWDKYRGWILSSPLKGTLVSMPEEIPNEWVFDYWKFATIGTKFDGANSSVFSTAALCCEADTESLLTERLIEIDKWFKSNCTYQEVKS
ncbi:MULTISPECIES: acetyl-CoA carboxylase biotin carboxylase subunit family protein [Niallia]|uniref:ATP-grasp domain-containing protein n=1 Tax=Niallia alba TaxID=2729105 RepID=A0A7Y0KBU6_9BACI|nr:MULTISPECIES: ATP-grasp domain-containing protein [Niallia]NMO79406.1 ATP-grasp domain-containing protein [Niallia alba]UTI42709.1 ATP-grasp domain-containing protein [Niallia sp. RD1]